MPKRKASSSSKPAAAKKPAGEYTLTVELLQLALFGFLRVAHELLVHDLVDGTDGFGGHQ